MNEDYKIIVFNDSVGRTCFGELAGETETELKIKDPAMIIVSPNEVQQMKVDVIPLFFKEFINVGEGNPETIFNFNKSSITVIEVNLSDRIIEHYFAKINIKPTDTTTEEEAIPEVKLFED